jgi:hypothetical protein
MPIELPPDEGPLDASWREPLSAVARAIVGQHRYRFFDLSDFMIMAKVVRRPRPTLVLYKHYYTRRYINLDAGAHAYRYSAPRDLSRPGRYLPYRTLTAALDALVLWELPWMKPGLEEHRFERTWDERWDLHPDWDAVDEDDAEDLLWSP